MKKSGITMATLVIYVVLLATFTGVALMVSNNLSDTVLGDKGIAISMTNYEKVLYYLNKSAEESTSATVTATTITFSNGDIFEYNSEKGELKLNGGVLCKNVSEFNIGSIENNLLNVGVSFKKYTNTMTRNVILNIGEWVYAKEE